jgi:hypothetical protein
MWYHLVPVSLIFLSLHASIRYVEYDIQREPPKSATSSEANGSDTDGMVNLSS